jgi:hypothetical protein
MSYGMRARAPAKGRRKKVPQSEGAPRAAFLGRPTEETEPFASQVVLATSFPFALAKACKSRAKVPITSCSAGHALHREAPEDPALRGTRFH